MILSMTGFGKEMLHCEGMQIAIEIKTLNSKQLDLLLKIPSLFKERESDLRSLVGKSLERGKIEVSIVLEKVDIPTTTIDHDLFKHYYHDLLTLSEELQTPTLPDIFAQVLKIPDVVISAKTEISETLWTALSNAVLAACKKVTDFRESEGKALAHDLATRTRLIDQMIAEITPHEKQRIENLRLKFIQHLENLNIEVGYDKNRMEEELMFYIERLDITEEKIRLHKHCEYFLETMREERANGKKLGFIAQEFGREVNTLGSKANDFNIQQVVVRMKDEVEKIKEQLANIL
ncbi:MAG: YicC family protein [Bacteroidales bacterium]|jgi:uncharacterized protein (TIGR00255 family)|nr:YicC family protein [Bacteroidales bacterium]